MNLMRKKPVESVSDTPRGGNVNAYGDAYVEIYSDAAFVGHGWSGYYITRDHGVLLCPTDTKRPGGDG